MINTTDLEPSDDFIAQMMASAQEDPSFGCTADMDAPGTPKSQPAGRRFGGAEVRRFRRRSTAPIEKDGFVSPERQQQLTLIIDAWNMLCTDQSVPAEEATLHIDQVAQIVKSNYTPSAVEIDRVMMWLDTSKDGLVSFDEYCVGMAGVMTAAGLSSADVKEAKEALSADIAQVIFPEGVVAEAAEVAHSPLAIEAVRGILGPELLEWMRTNFDSADTNGSGELDSEQLTELIKQTYVPRGNHLDKFMKWFQFDFETKLIKKPDYIDGMFKLQADLSFELSTQACISPENLPAMPSPLTSPEAAPLAAP